MRWCFYVATAFNQPLQWKISNVIDMTGMFAEAHSFNQSLVNWAFGNGAITDAMLRSAKSYDQELPDHLDPAVVYG